MEQENDTDDIDIPVTRKKVCVYCSGLGYQMQFLRQDSYNCRIREVPCQGCCPGILGYVKWMTRKAAELYVKKN